MEKVAFAFFTPFRAQLVASYFIGEIDDSVIRLPIDVPLMNTWTDRDSHVVSDRDKLPSLQSIVELRGIAAFAEREKRNGPFFQP